MVMRLRKSNHGRDGKHSGSASTTKCPSRSPIICGAISFVPQVKVKAAIDHPVELLNQPPV
jgi:hypothetical protein